MDALRQEPDVAHDGNASGHESANDRGHVGAAFDFDSLAAGLLKDAGGRFQCAIGAQVADGKWQVDNGQRAIDSSSYDFGVVQQVIERGGQRRVVALDGHGETIADEHGIDSRFVDQPGGWKVVSGDHRQLPARRLGGGKRRGRQA
jgi:hypothetical protein